LLEVKEPRLWLAPGIGSEISTLSRRFWKRKSFSLEEKVKRMNKPFLPLLFCPGYSGNCCWLK
jgi:hypothetical protein